MAAHTIDATKTASMPTMSKARPRSDPCRGRGCVLMTDTTSRRFVAPPATPTPTPPPALAPTYEAPATRTGWAGWVIFAAVMMTVVGAFQFIEGLTALFRRSYYLVVNDDLLVRLNYTGWGWIHMIIGGLLVIAGLGLFTGRMWARVIAVTLAGLSALVNLAFIPAYPWWAITVIALDVFVIYAICVHGRELRT